MSASPRIALLALVLLAGTDAALPRSRPLPHRLAVAVAHGSPRGPQLLLDDLRTELVALLEAADCFSGVREARGAQPPDADLLLRVSLDGFEEDVEHDVSLAEEHSPDLPPTTGHRSARLRANVSFELLTVAESAVVRSRRMLAVVERRPLLDTDPRPEAALAWIEDVARNARSFACKGSTDKRSREIERARASTRSAEHGTSR